MIFTQKKWFLSIVYWNYQTKKIELTYKINIKPMQILLSKLNRKMTGDISSSKQSRY